MIAPTSFFADYGCHVRILEEARILQSLGHSITIATYRNGKDVAESISSGRCQFLGDATMRSAQAVTRLLLTCCLASRHCNCWLRKRFDIIHAHLHEGALMGLVFGRMFSLPVVFDFQGSLTEEMIDHQFLRRDSVLYGGIRRLEEWIDHRSSVILASSGNAERILVDEFPAIRPSSYRSGLCEY